LGGSIEGVGHFYALKLSFLCYLSQIESI
jgi:hypothetical protein